MVLTYSVTFSIYLKRTLLQYVRHDITTVTNWRKYFINRLKVMIYAIGILFDLTFEAISIRLCSFLFCLWTYRFHLLWYNRLHCRSYVYIECWYGVSHGLERYNSTSHHSHYPPSSCIYSLFIVAFSRFVFHRRFLVDDVLFTVILLPFFIFLFLVHLIAIYYFIQEKTADSR